MSKTFFQNSYAIHNAVVSVVEGRTSVDDYDFSDMPKGKLVVGKMHALNERDRFFNHPLSKKDQELVKSIRWSKEKYNKEAIKKDRAANIRESGLRLATVLGVITTCGVLGMTIPFGLCVAAISLSYWGASKLNKKYRNNKLEEFRDNLPSDPFAHSDLVEEQERYERMDRETSIIFKFGQQVGLFLKDEPANDDEEYDQDKKSDKDQKPSVG